MPGAARSGRAWCLKQCAGAWQKAQTVSGVHCGALVVACEQEAASWGDGVLGLHHDRTDQKLVRFYRKLGFAGDGVPLKHQGFELVYVAKRVRPS